MPEFQEEIKSYFLIDFSVEKPQSSFTIGHLSDYENDWFILEVQNAEALFATVSIDSENMVTLEVDLGKASKHENGNYTLNFQVKEFYGATDTVQSKQLYSVQIEVKGLKIFEFVPTKNEIAHEDDKVRPTMAFEKINRFGLAEVSFNQTLSVPQNWTQINDTVLEIKVDPFDLE